MIRLAASLIALSLLAGCGIKGGLERPSPIWGGENAVARERAQTEEERAEAERRRQGVTEPGEASPTIPPLPE